ncbi:MAG: hypothetical protein WDW36_002280 [Sanguina aurantia]
MVTEELLDRGSVLVKVPRRLLMTLTTAQASPEYGTLIVSAGLNEWQALLLHLLAERAQGPLSFWAPYLAVLPDQLQHPLFSISELLVMLQGSPMALELAGREEQIQSDTEVLLISGANDLPLALQYQAQHHVELVTTESVRWAAATLVSRAFNLDLSEEEPLEGDMSYFGTWQPVPDVLALVPWADMLCHTSEAGPESCLRYNSDLGAVTLAAHKDYEAGEEVFDSYGPKLSPSELMLNYGFVDEKCTNFLWEAHPGNTVPVRASRNRALLEALEKMQGPARVVLSPDGPDEILLATVRASLATDAELVRSGWRIRATADETESACRVMAKLSEPISSASEAKVLQHLATYVQLQQSKYPSTLEEDIATLQDTSLSG